jgi:ribose transport system permease protein
LLKRIVAQRETTLLAMIVMLAIAISLLSPYFLTTANLRVMLVGMVPTAIIAVGMTALLVSGAFDLSVGSVLALSSTLCAMMLMNGMSIPVSVALTLLLGATVGLLNGGLVTTLRINPLVATLGTMSAARGFALVLTEGFSLSALPPSFGLAGSSDIFGLPVMVWLMFAVVILGDLALRHLAFLRQIYFVGSNEKAARLSGISVGLVRTAGFVLCSALAALAGILLASRLMSGTPTAGYGLELQVLAAAVIGGASLSGGEGTVLGAFLGVVFVSLISNAMTMLSVSIYWQMIVTGGVLVLAVAIDKLTTRSQAET